MLSSFPLFGCGRPVASNGAYGRGLIAIFVLGGLQGAAGWWMVASGLTERTDVSQYRLAIHVILAALIFAYLIWVARGLRPPRPAAEYPSDGTRLFANVLIVLVFLQLYFGALVAGLDAGLVYNDWPTMGGAFVPPDFMVDQPWWRNFFEDEATVQFQHRMLAYMIAVWVIVHAIVLARRMPGSRTAFSSYRLLALVGLQIAVGGRHPNVGGSDFAGSSPPIRGALAACWRCAAPSRDDAADPGARLRCHGTAVAASARRFRRGQTSN